MGGLLVERCREADGILGKRKEKEEATATYYVSSIIPRSPSIHDLGVILSPPVFLSSDGRRKYPILDGQGRPIAEVFELHSNRNYSKIHGTLWILGGFGRFNLFERSHSNSQVVDHNDSLEFCPISRALEAYDNIYVGLHLMEGSNEIVNERFHMWNPACDAHDVVHNYVYHGSESFGTWPISYVVYKEAVVAGLQINFKSNKSSSIAICGTITASSNMFPDRRIVLFSKGTGVGEYHNIVEQGGQQVLIPLLRSVAAVPLNRVPVHECGDPYNRVVDGCFLIDMNLVNIHDGGAIAKGVLEFPVEYFGEYVGAVSSMYGEMQFKVSFMGLFEHLRKCRE